MVGGQDGDGMQRGLWKAEVGDFQSTCLGLGGSTEMGAESPRAMSAEAEPRPGAWC
jgi:hypothetical protein